MKDIDFNKIEKETTEKFKSLLRDGDGQSFLMTVAHIEMSAEICKVMLQKYHESLSKKNS